MWFEDGDWELIDYGLYTEVYGRGYDMSDGLEDEVLHTRTPMHRNQLLQVLLIIVIRIDVHYEELRLHEQCTLLVYVGEVGSQELLHHPHPTSVAHPPSHLPRLVLTELPNWVGVGYLII